MNKLPNDLILQIANRRARTKQNVSNLARVSGTSKRFYSVLSPRLRLYRSIKNLYNSLLKNRLGMVIPLRPRQMQESAILLEYPFMLQPGNRPSINYGQRKTTLNALKKLKKSTIIKHSQGKTFTLNNGTSYTLRPNGNLVSHRGARNRVMYKNVKNADIGL